MHDADVDASLFEGSKLLASKEVLWLYLDLRIAGMVRPHQARQDIICCGGAEAEQELSRFTPLCLLSQ